MRRWLFVLMLLGNLGFAPLAPSQQTAVIFSAVDASYSYGQQAIFKVTIQPVKQVKELYLFLEPSGLPVRVEKVTPSADGSVLFTYDLKANPLRPFALTRFWFRASLVSGSEQTSSIGEFSYDDNRFQWQTLQDPQFQVFWYGRDLPFGQDVLNIARQGLQEGQHILPASLPAPLRIYVYSTAQDFQQAMQVAGQSWMVGHASPEVGTILVSVPSGPDQKLELQRQVPHEIAHVLQYQLVGAAYVHVPNWLLEGTASLAEIYPNPDYQSALNNAVQNEALIPLNQLCGPFPREASSAFLAYAESASFTRYLHTRYGTSGIGSLFHQYQDGIGCQEGPSRAFQSSLDELDYSWRQEMLGVNVGSLVLRNLSPYLALLALLIFIPLLAGLSMRRKQKESGV